MTTPTSHPAIAPPDRRPYLHHMGIYSWDLDGGFGNAPLVRTPRLTVRCEYEDQPPTEVTFRLSQSYGVHTAREAHDWFLCMLRSHDEFVVETDKPGELPMPFCSETVRRVVVE